MSTYSMILYWTALMYSGRRTLRKMRGKTPDEKLKIQTLRNTLTHRIKKWRTIQVLYMPIVTTFLSNDNDDVPDNTSSSARTALLPENIKLWMPSQVPQQRWATGIATGLAKKEERLRIAEADVALHQVGQFLSFGLSKLLTFVQVRRYIRMRMGLVHFKGVHVAGRGGTSNTCAQDAINSIWLKVTRAADRYIASYTALQSLCPDGGPWSRRLRPLDTKTDLRNAAGIDPEDDDLTNQRPAARRARMLGDGHTVVPWIWTVLEHNGSDVIGDDATEAEVVEGSSTYKLFSGRCSTDLHSTMVLGMRSVYCKARARVLRWQEEITLLLEEMRRVVTFFVWKRNWWLGQRNLRPQAKLDIQQGANAYAERQALVYAGLAKKFAKGWRKMVTKEGLSQRWPNSIDTLIASLSPQSSTTTGSPSTGPSTDLLPAQTDDSATRNAAAAAIDIDVSSPTAPHATLPVPPSSTLSYTDDAPLNPNEAESGLQTASEVYDETNDDGDGLDDIEDENDSEMSDQDSGDDAEYCGPEGYDSD